MIDKTFLHCTSVGPKTQEKLFSLGFNSWQDCLNKQDLLPFKGLKLEQFLSDLNKSNLALQKKDLVYLVNTFPLTEHWRILGEFFDQTTFFDIETTGISGYNNHATVITAFKHPDKFTFVHGQNLDDFLALADDSLLLASFNGNAFDIPFLENTFHIPGFTTPHVDLRWIAYHSGFKGGLKEIEKNLGVTRPKGFEEVTGMDAVRLFYEWQAGDKTAKENLIKYCLMDTLSTLVIAGQILNKKGYEIKIDFNKLIGDL